MMMIQNRYFGYTVVTCISLLVGVDRSATGAVLDEIKQYFKLNSSQAGLLGTLYPIGQVLAGPFFGYLGDRYPRKWIIIGALTFWNLSSMGISQISQHQYYFLFLARFFAGMGAVGFLTVANVVVADLIVPQQRKAAFSFYYLVSFMGTGLGLTMGSLVLSLADWRWVYRIGPGISMPLLFCLIIMEEPKRGGLDGAKKKMVDTDTVLSNIRYLLSMRSFLWSTIGYICFEFYEVGAGFWLVSYVMMGLPEIRDSVSAIMGAMVFVFGPLGIYIGILTSRKLSRHFKNSNPLLCSISMIGVALTISLYLLAMSYVPLFTWPLFALIITLLVMILSPMIEILVEVIPPNKRAFADSIQQVSGHLFGSSTGPYVIGLVKNTLEHRMENKFNAFSLALLMPILAQLIGGLSFLQSSRYYVEDMKEAADALEKENQKNEESLN